MRKVLLTVTISVIALAILGSVGCRILGHNQPTYVDDGEQFTVMVETEIDNIGDYDPGYGCIAIMLPDSFSVDGGTYDAPDPFSDGTLVDTGDLGRGMAHTFYDATHPCPTDYEWQVWRTSNTYDPDGGGGAYAVDFYVDITAGLSGRTDHESFTISYAVGGYEQGDTDVQYFGDESEMSWDNPIHIGGVAVENVSFGEIKVDFH
jgi:hypothetical protein